MMLVISRRPGEGVLLALPDGRVVRVTINRAGGAVRLGIDAPPDVKISRAEVREEVQSADEAVSSG